MREAQLQSIKSLTANRSTFSALHIVIVTQSFTNLPNQASWSLSHSLPYSQQFPLFSLLRFKSPDSTASSPLVGNKRMYIERTSTSPTRTVLVLFRPTAPRLGTQSKSIDTGVENQFDNHRPYYYPNGTYAGDAFAPTTTFVSP